MVNDFQDILYLKSCLKTIDLALLVIFLSKKSHNNRLFLQFDNFKYLMQNLILSKRSRALFGIGIVALSIGLILKKVIKYPAGGCMKGTQEITFNI